MEFVLEHVSHGYQFGRAALGSQSVIGGAGAAATTADQRQLNQAASFSVDVWNGDSRQGGSGGEVAGCFDKLTAGTEMIGGLVHAHIILTLALKCQFKNYF